MIMEVVAGVSTTGNSTVFGPVTQDTNARIAITDVMIMFCFMVILFFL